MDDGRLDPTDFPPRPNPRGPASRRRGFTSIALLSGSALLGLVLLAHLATSSSAQDSAAEKYADSDPAKPTTVEPAPSQPRRSSEEIESAAAELDRILESRLEGLELEPNPNVDDTTFLRRLFLDVVGRIPTAAEQAEFNRDSKDVRRSRWIDRLLTSPGHVSHAFNYWSDVLRMKNRLNNQVSGLPYVHWLKQSLVDNKPYDQQVKELLGASGPAYARGNGATGYLLRDRGMPLDNMATSVRVFLGTRLECAQCHNHPTEPWKQRQFFEMAAFAGGLRYSHLEPRELRGYRQLQQRVRKDDGQQAFRQVRRAVFTLSAGIGGDGNGLARLPSDYEYDDAKPRDLVTAKSIFSNGIELHPKLPREPRRKRKNRRNRPVNAPSIDSRTAFASWVASTDNPRFTRVIVNRMWERYFGQSLTPKFDDLKGESVAIHPELEASLERWMRSFDYDLIEFQRVLLRTRAYQRKAFCLESSKSRYAFQGPLLRRLTAEQLWDSLVTLVVPDLDDTVRVEPPGVAALYNGYEALESGSPDTLLATLQESGPALTDPRAQMRQTQRQAQAIFRRYHRGVRRRDAEVQQKARAELEALGLDVDRFLKSRRYGRDLVRASEVGQPAPAAHFLREFGQSDRDQTESSHQDANVPQALRLLNGFVDQRLLRSKNSVLSTNLKRAKRPQAKIRTAFTHILSRPPSQEESRLWLADVRQYGNAAYQDLVWTLLNSHEFRFQR